MKVYKELDLEQGSDEWLVARRCHITATDSSKIKGKNPYSTALDCYNEKIEGKTTPLNAAMKRGQELEVKAREFLCESTATELKAKVFESIKYPYLMASMDAVSNDNSMGYEIKCPLEKAMKRALEGDYDKYYEWQCQKQMLVMGWNFITLFYYHTDSINIGFKIKRDEKFIKEIINSDTHFWHDHILKEIPPAQSFQSVKNIDDLDANELARVWRVTSEAAKELKAELLVMEAKLKEISNNESVFFVKAGVKHLVIERAGTVDWKKACVSWEISEEEIEKYRKGKSKYSKFTIVDKEKL